MSKVGKSGLYLFMGLIFLIGSCNEDTPLLSTSLFPGDRILEISPGSQVTISFSGRATHQNLERVSIWRTSSSTGKQILLDTVVNQGSFEYLHKVIHSGFTDSIFYQLSFSCTGSESGESVKSINIIELPDSSVTPLRNNEYSLYTEPDARENAFSLELKGVRYNPPLADNMVSFRDSTSKDSLSLVWVSPKGGEFVRYNNFNFNSATKQAVEQAYLLGSPLNLVSGIQEGDIILYSEIIAGKRVYAAILVSRIEYGSSPRYVVYVKSQHLE